MSARAVDAIANALLYEGYILYPYRASAVKNQCRWNFGVVYPRAYAEAQTGADAWRIETECLVIGTPQTSVDIQVRFLRLVERIAGRFEPQFHALPSVEVDGRFYESWQEAAEHSVSRDGNFLGALLRHPVRHAFLLPAEEEIQQLRDASGFVSAALVRKREAISGLIDVSATDLGDGVFRLTVGISNVAVLPMQCRCSREQALAQSLLSAHTVLAVHHGEFVSLLDPPDRLREVAGNCRNIGTWPVLVGDPASTDTMLSSPIILYDYPAIAPESPGDLFDGTEIDEILTLRILTLTEREKAEMRRSDERARRLLERAESLPADHFMKLHGVLREAAPHKSGDRQ